MHLRAQDIVSEACWSAVCRPLLLCATLWKSSTVRQTRSLCEGSRQACATRNPPQPMFPLKAKNATCREALRGPFSREPLGE